MLYKKFLRINGEKLQKNLSTYISPGANPIQQFKLV